MFLAWREIKHDKRHFGLITAVISLVGILVFFLTGLAVGLMTIMTQGITNLGADDIALSDSANDSVQASIIPTKNAEKLKADEVSLLGLSALTIKKDADTQLTAFAFGMEPNSFTAPEVSEGKMYLADKEVVVDSKFKTDGYKLGDEIKVTQGDETFKIVGFTKNATYSSYPIVFMNLKDWRETGIQFKDAVSAVATKGSVDQDSVSDANLKLQSVKDFNNNIPGVSAQNLTFALMVGALIVVSAVILGVFIFVLTLQKRRVFGVMKAQGIDNATLGWSVIWQTAFLSIFGSIFAVAITLATAAAMPEAVPFTVPWLLFGIIGAVMVLFSLLGALFSVRSATRIDPLIALK
ncbi:hypothetical protein BK816_00895 [Boudabousia tangfeifanii]|uniref:ABC3 transporter permease C-terminal domain-containing protein n=1 Tax=Boudabousia tangfeifanii TaxID=1912795 RepID=A0A1D9MIJ1_9ACTO|nr:ABC transporter permease [Boudabousia tangfeifanii]AOZ72028.1 hypothetical protein BK816_00895 [Boudabousia tangfeifanii]